MQQRVYVDEFKKRLVESRLVWSRTLSTLLSTNGESIILPACVSAKADILNEQLHKPSPVVPGGRMFYR